MPLEEEKIFCKNLNFILVEDVSSDTKSIRVIEELYNEDNSDLWMMLLESNRFEEIFSILAGGLREILFNKIDEIKVLKNMHPSFNSMDLIRKGKLKR